MRLLLCAATKFEIEGTLVFLEQHPEIRNKVDVLITGVGLTAATYWLTRRILQTKPSFVLQAGICGSLDEALELSEVVVVEKESIGDLGVMERGNFSSLFNLGFLTKNETPWTNGKLANHIAVLRKTGLPIVDGVTINEITTNKERINFYREELRTSIESMEGAALHYVCLSEKIPFLQLRSVSNYVGERDKKRWALAGSIAALNTQLQSLLIKMFTS